MAPSIKVITALLAFFEHARATATKRSSVLFNGPFEVEADGAENIHLSYAAPIDGELAIYYGDCALESFVDAHHKVGSTHVGDHPLAKRHSAWSERRPNKFVWLPPSDTPDQGCLHAFVDGYHVGKSEKCAIKKKRALKRAVSFADIADPEGPWFDGVQYLKQKEPEDVFVSSVKSKKFGIIGGGMSGLMTAYLLESVGITDWEILEASNRIGGRVHTSYLNGTSPDEYQYQEMGPMRFPVSYTDSETNETVQIMDHRMVFQLADTLNKMNGNDSSLAVNFIKWIQASPNDPVATSNTTYANATAVADASEAYEKWIDVDAAKLRSIATNVFRAHKAAIEAGNLDFSEAGYLRYVLKTDLNTADELDDITDNAGSWEYDSVYFGASEWRTIDKGLSSLPKAFGPLVLNRTRFNTSIQEISYDDSTGKVTVGWRPTDLFAQKAQETATFDYVTVAVPFTQVRMWRLPSYSSLLSRAISRLGYGGACKVALHYETRFWEHLEKPIIGGCGSTNIPMVGSVCYPSYKINSTGPGVLLASYLSGSNARSAQSLSEEEHVALIQRAMVEIHGEVAAEQYTGNYDRICWANMEGFAGSWAEPTTGQHELYIPAYYKTEQHTVFVGEHTSFTHAWIFSALESAVRGSAQLLLDLGLVDEAKQVTDQWMARWMSI